MPATSSGMYYETRGNGSRTIVLLPGFGSSTDSWAQIADRLPGHRSLIVDLPGHARSAGVPTDGHLPSMASTIRTAVRELVEPPWVVAGLSMGAAIAMRMALDHPDDVTALIGVVPWNAAGTSADNPAFAAQAELHGNAEALAQVVSAISQDPSATGGLAQDMLTVSPQMWHGWLTGGAFASQAAELPGLRVPMFSLIGGQDVVVDQAEQIEDVRRVPTGRLVLRNELGHLCCYEAPDAVAAEIDDFLRRIPVSPDVAPDGDRPSP